MAFLLGFPANEIVLPIIIMAYLSSGSLLALDDLEALRGAAGGQRLDLADGGVHHALFPGPHGLLHDLPDHWEGDGQRQMDPGLHPAATGIGMLVCFSVATTAVCWAWPEKRRAPRSRPLLRLGPGRFAP